MGQMWVKVDDTWVRGYPFERVTEGWKTGRVLWRKNGGTWTNIWQKDTTPPSTPLPTTFSFNTTTKAITVNVHVPADTDIVRAILKWGNKGSAATSPTSRTDGQYVGQGMPDGSTWSDFPVTPGQTVSRVTGAASPGYTYYTTVWVQDTSYNWSARRVDSYTPPVPTVTSPTVASKTANFSPVDSCSWNAQSDYWRTDNNYVYQGGYDWRGFWFYGTQISGALASAKRITKMTLKITRANTVHGVAGEANVWMMAHKRTTQGTATAEGYHTTAIKVGTLGRGETGTFDVPSVWWPYFVSGAYKGLGLAFGTTGFTDSDYMYAYGNAVVHIEWEQ